MASALSGRAWAANLAGESVLDYGAVGDGKTVDADALQRVITACGFRLERFAGKAARAAAQDVVLTMSNRTERLFASVDNFSFVLLTGIPGEPMSLRFCPFTTFQGQNDDFLFWSTSTRK